MRRSALLLVAAAMITGLSGASVSAGELVTLAIDDTVVGAKWFRLGFPAKCEKLHSSPATTTMHNADCVDSTEGRTDSQSMRGLLGATDGNNPQEPMKRYMAGTWRNSPSSPNDFYDPADMGPISSGDMSFYVEVLSTTNSQLDTIVAHALIHQGTNNYVSKNPVIVPLSPGEWTLVEINDFQPSDFYRVTIGSTDPSQPVFDETGAPMNFGFAVDGIWGFDFPGLEYQVRYRVDDFHLEIRTNDADDDQVADFVDTCTDVKNGPNESPNDQFCDSDSDGFGNACDCDFPASANGACDGGDFAVLGAEWGNTAPPADLSIDMNCNGAIDGGDFGFFGQGFGGLPGSSCGNPKGTPCDP